MATVICLKGFAIFTGLCLAQSARAEPKYVPKIIPNCQVVQISPGIRRCAYTLEDVKNLYRIDSEFSLLKTTSSLQRQKIILQDDIILWQQDQIELSSKNTTLFHKRMNTLTNLYIKTDKRLQEELSRPRWGHYIAWGLTVAVTTLLVGYIAADQMDK